MSKILQCIFGLVLLLFCDVAFARSAPVGWYPPEYEKKTEKEWPAMKKQIGSLLAGDNLDDDSMIDAAAEVSFILARLGKIKWSADEKKDVISELQNFIRALTNRESRIHHNGEYAQGKFDRGISNSTLLIRQSSHAFVQIDVVCASDFFTSLWKNLGTTKLHLETKRIILLECASHSRQESIQSFIRNICDMSKELDKTEEQLIGKILLVGLLSKKTQREAWEFLWEKNKTENLDNTMQLAVWHRWNSNIRIMEEAHEKLSPVDTFKIAHETEDHSKKYVFLSCTIWILNSKGPSSTTEGERFLWSDVTKEIKTISGEINSATTKKQNEAVFCNFLKKAIDARAKSLEARMPKNEAHQPKNTDGTDVKGDTQAEVNIN